MKALKWIAVIVLAVIAGIWGLRTIGESVAMGKIQGEYRQGLIQDLPASERDEANALFDRLKARGITAEDAKYFHRKIDPILKKKQEYISNGHRWPASTDFEELSIIRTIVEHSKGTPYPE